MAAWNDYQQGRYGNPALIAQNWRTLQNRGEAQSGTDLTNALAQHMGLSPGTAAPAAPAPVAPRRRWRPGPPGAAGGIPGFNGGPLARTPQTPAPGAAPAPLISQRSGSSSGASTARPGSVPVASPALPPPLPPPNTAGLPSSAGSISALSAATDIPAAPRATGAALPGRIRPAAGLAPAPGREQLGGEDAVNDLEQMGRDRLSGPVDPGQQYGGRDVAERVFSDAQINQLAQQQAEPLLRALADEQEQLVAAAAAGGGGVDPAALRALRSRAAAETAAGRGAAMRDATLNAAKANAAQQLAAAGSRREDFNADMAARLGLGKLGADVGSELLSAGQQQRGLKQTRDISRFQGGIEQRGKEMDYAAEGGRQRLTARGQDVAQRADDIGYNTSRLNADVAQRGQDTTRSIAGANLSAENARTRANLDLERELGLGRLGNEARGQDVSARGQDIEAQLGLGRLGNERYGIDTSSANAAADRQSRMAELETRLQSERLTDQERNALERERIALQREIFQGEQAGTESRFGRSLEEQQRQFDRGQEFEREEGRTGRNFRREMSGGYGNPQQDVQEAEARQRQYNNWLSSNWGGAAGDAFSSGRDQQYIDEILRQLRQMASAA